MGLGREGAQCPGEAQTTQQQLNQATSQARRLQSELSKARASIAAQQAESTGGSSGGSSTNAQPDFSRDLTMQGPGPQPSQNAIDIDQGQVIIDGVGAASLIYQQRTAGSYELDVNLAEGSTAAVLTSADATPTSADQCKQYVQSEPFPNCVPSQRVCDFVWTPAVGSPCWLLPRPQIAPVPFLSTRPTGRTTEIYPTQACLLGATRKIILNVSHHNYPCS